MGSLAHTLNRLWLFRTISFGHAVLLSAVVSLYICIIFKMLGSMLGYSTAQFYAEASTLYIWTRFRVKWNWRRFIALYFLGQRCADRTHSLIDRFICSYICKNTLYAIRVSLCSIVMCECECASIYELDETHRWVSWNQLNVAADTSHHHTDSFSDAVTDKPHIHVA